MPKETQIIEAEGIAVEISHPEKILYAEAGLSKMDLVRYYTAAWPYLKKFGMGRPLAIKRYPHGAGGDSFFQKNKPHNAPEWLTSRLLGLEKKADYIILDKLATLLWLVNLDSLEFHSALVAAPNYDKPNLLAFDLDPPPGSTFPEIRDFALACRPIIEGFGYRCFAKTSGKRGVHICCPLPAPQSFEQVFNAAKEVATTIIEKIPGCTLSLKKEDRPDKILIDIYRNHPYQLMVLPYSTRATPNASVSMPLSWEELGRLEDAGVFDVGTVVEKLKKGKDEWEEYYPK